MIHLRWAKAKDGWLPLALPWPSVIDTVGVYVIWHEGNPSRVVRVGHGEGAFTITRKIRKCWPIAASARSASHEQRDSQTRWRALSAIWLSIGNH